MTRPSTDSGKHTAKRDGFQKRSGCFECSCCGRQTRRTAKQQNRDMCPHCDEWSMIENGISDNDLEGDELAHAEAVILKLKEKAASLGGSRERLDLPVLDSIAKAQGGAA